MSGDAVIIEAIRQAVPPGRSVLTDADVSLLRDLTTELISARPRAASEYRRFLAVAGRGLCLPEEQVARALRGATILVTGGTGCIGSALIQQIAAYQPAHLVSVSRGITRAARHTGVEYLTADVTDREAVGEIVTSVRPDIIFHVAAQRSPGLAETEVHRTVSTNVLGARNVLAEASRHAVSQVVLASTGKALRPYSPEVYTASKRVAEWLGETTAESTGTLCSAARFTHVIDNSIIHKRLLDWAAAGDPQADSAAVTAIRLHGADIAFYVQSALESAQLLLIAMAGAVPGAFRVHAITELGWPVSLLDVALGVLSTSRSRTPIYLSGYDPGYEEVPFPGLYDPATAGDVSPLLNAFETATLASTPCPRVDSFTMRTAANDTAPKLLDELDAVCGSGDCGEGVRRVLDDLSWSLLDATLAMADPMALGRAAKLTRLHEQGMSYTHRRITRSINAHAEGSR